MSETEHQGRAQKQAQHVKRYRLSPVRGLVEDDGGIYPIGVSQPMVLASDFDDVDRERMLAQGWGESILEKLKEVYEQRDRYHRRLIEEGILK